VLIHSIFLAQKKIFWFLEAQTLKADNNKNSDKQKGSGRIFEGKLTNTEFRWDRQFGNLNH
jgi:hypothetical protein